MNWNLDIYTHPHYFIPNKNINTYPLIRRCSVMTLLCRPKSDYTRATDSCYSNGYIRLSCMECYSCQNYHNVLCTNTAPPHDHSAVRFICSCVCVEFLTYRISIYTYLKPQPVLRAISDLPYIHLYISETTACAARNF